MKFMAVKCAGMKAHGQLLPCSLSFALNVTKVLI